MFMFAMSYRPCRSPDAMRSLLRCLEYSAASSQGVIAICHSSPWSDVGLVVTVIVRRGREAADLVVASEVETTTTTVATEHLTDVVTGLRHCRCGSVQWLVAEVQFRCRLLVRLQ